MRNTCCIISLLGLILSANAQSPTTNVRAGNRLYREGKFNRAIPEYQKALELQPGNVINSYNLGNAFFRTEKYEDAVKWFDKASAGTDDSMNQHAAYNTGVSFSRANKLEESIAAYKKAVIMNPADSDARINLQKALTELKKKNESQKEKKEDEKNKQQKNKDQTQPPPKSKLTKKQVEQFLKALQQREQQVQQKMMQNKTRSSTKPDKDW